MTVKVEGDEMRHIDLFTGIGGFAYAAQQIWGTEYQNVFFCENNRFCWEVIKKNFGKDSVIYGDIREVTADSHYERQTKQKQQTAGDKQCDRSITLLTGGFPCQPFSCAGKRRGTEDNRHLWPEMFRVIKDYKPRWIIAENVRGIINIQDGVVFQQVCLDLESEGYQTQAFIIPALAVGAPHRRDRVWIIAHARCEYGARAEDRKESQGKILCEKNASLFKRPISDDGERVAPDSTSKRCDKRKQEDNRPCENEKPIGFTEKINEGIFKQSEFAKSKTVGDSSNSSRKGLQRPGGEVGENDALPYRGENWEQNWLEVATEICGMDDGLPAELDGFKLTKAGHRVERLKALGNAIVPQVAMEIMRAIKYAEEK